MLAYAENPSSVLLDEFNNPDEEAETSDDEFILGSIGNWFEFFDINEVFTSSLSTPSVSIVCFFCCSVDFLSWTVLLNFLFDEEHNLWEG